MADSAIAAVPHTLLAALGPDSNTDDDVLASESTTSLPIPSASYLVSASRTNSPSPANPLEMNAVLSQSDRPDSLVLDGGPLAGSAGFSSDQPPRHSMSDSVDTRAYQDSQTRTSEDGRLTSSENRDSVPSKSGGPLTTVSEHGPAGDSRRVSNAHTFGQSGQSDGEPNSREHSFSGDRKGGLSPSIAPSPTPSLVPPPPRFSVADPDALRRQSMRSSKLSKDGEPDLEKADLSEKKQDLPLATSEEGVVRSNSIHRLTLNTTIDSSTGYAPCESSNGHSEYWKKPVVHQGHIPRSSYYVGPPAIGSAFGTEPMGEIGVHFPREIVRIERDYSGGELVQLYPTYPLEFEGRITPNHFQASINEINEVLISAHSLRHSAFEHMLGVATLYLSTLVLETHYQKEMRRLARLFDTLNRERFNPVGLNLLWPRKVAFLFLEIEYY